MASKTIIVTKHHLEMWRSKNNRCNGSCRLCGKQFQVGDEAIQKNRGEPTLWEFYEQNDTCRQEPEI